MQVFLAAALALLGACAPIAPPNPAGQEQALQWTVLLDDAGPRGLRTMGEQALRPQWQMTDGALVLTTPGGGDFTDGKVYRDFELIVEWAVPEAGNSGIFLRADPDEGTAAWKSAVEYQLLDNAGHPNGADLATSAGAVFALYPTLSQALAPIGSFNTTRIVAKGPVIEHYLNGTLLPRATTRPVRILRSASDKASSRASPVSAPAPTACSCSRTTRIGSPSG